jgi:two-component system NtrC family sensor kinase
MRLARKLILAMVVGVAVVLAVNAYYRVQRELAAFDADMERDHQVLGAILRRTVTSVWEASGREAALGTLHTAVPASGEVRLRWIDAGARPSRPLARDHLHTEVPITVGGARQGTIEISESRRFERDYARATVVRTVVLTLLAVLGAGTLATILGVWFVGRPIDQLVEKARRVGSGDVEDPLVIHQRDELGVLAQEMNAMCVRLAEARAALDAETRELLRTQEQLRHADRLATVGKLASGIAHELGTPLGVALMRANLIATNPSLGREVRDAGRIVSEQIDRITHIVRHLLDFARGSTATSPTSFRHREPASLVAIAQRSVAMLEPLARKRQVAIELVSVPQPPEPPADAAQIQQVLVNLLVNAIQASRGPGKIVVDVGATEARPPADVTPVLWSEDGQPRYAVLSVRDEGEGIAPEILPRIFEPFFTTKDVGEGTGLGLSVAYGMVREHGGWIDVSSEPDRGSCFKVYLPMQVAELEG